MASFDELPLEGSSSQSHPYAMSQDATKTEEKVCPIRCHQSTRWSSHGPISTRIYQAFRPWTDGMVALTCARL